MPDAISSEDEAIIARLPEFAERPKLIHGAYSIHRAEWDVFNRSDALSRKIVRRRARRRIEELGERLWSDMSTEDLRQFEIREWGKSASEPHAFPRHKWVTRYDYSLRQTARDFLAWVDTWQVPRGSRS